MQHPCDYIKLVFHLRSNFPSLNQSVLRAISVLGGDRQRNLFKDFVKGAQMSKEGFAGMLTISGCLWLVGQASHMVASYGQLTRKGESQWVNPMASLLRIMSQPRILSISHMEQQKPAWGLNNLDKNVNTCLFRRCFNCSVSSGRHRQVWKGSYAGCAHFSNSCTHSRVAAPASEADWH